MKFLSMGVWSVVIGAATEGILCLIAWSLGTWGGKPEEFNLASQLFLIPNVPGMWLARHLLPESQLPEHGRQFWYLVLMVSVTISFLSMAAYFVLTKLAAELNREADEKQPDQD